MQKMFERLEHFAQRAHNLPLERGVSHSVYSVWRATPTNSAVDDSAICGRDDEKQNLKEYLLSEGADGGSKIGVLAIVGMGGLGKTTLAKLLYNNAQVKEKFDIKAWTSVSKDFDAVNFAKSLLESLTSTATNLDNFDTLRAELQKNLSGKRFLLVLDDIWNARYVDWTNLMHIFNVGQMGSKIIVTTRHENIVAIVKDVKTCHLEPLVKEHCWTLLSKHALGAHKCTELPSNLEEIGRKIAEKCGGLPLAAVALGGLLSMKLSTDYWSKVLNSNIWHLTVNDVQPALLLSYHFLPSCLKQCFAYCAIFPKNSKLEKEELVHLWMAQGFVYVTQNEKSMEEVGGEYFDELVARSLIRRSMDGKHFEMHDLLNDLAIMVSTSYCKRCEDQKLDENLSNIRHLSYKKSTFNHFAGLNQIYGLKGLRTLLALPFEDWCHDNYLANKVLSKLFSAVKQLRVLSLSMYRNLTDLPNSIGNLKHLRYLNLSFTRIHRLPPQVCNLYNLQTLLLRNCCLLSELPEEIGKLVNLRFLDIFKTKLEEMPVEIAKLKNLQTLTCFIISKQHNGLKLADMRKFPNLQGILFISKLENVVDPYDACQANLKEKKQIRTLSLRWSNPILEDSQQVVLEHLQPNTNLKILGIHCYGGTSFPKWLGDSSFDNLVCLGIHDCRYCSSLPPLGQLKCLKELLISGMTSVKSIGCEFYGSNSTSFQPFPSLEILSFESMAEWEEWNLIDDGTATEFPRLSKLYLSNCPKLKGNFPSNLPCLVTLDVKDCSLLTSQISGEADCINILTPFNLFSKIIPFHFLQELNITRVPSLTSFPSNGLPKMLKKLSVYSCENLEFPTHEFLHSCQALEDLTIGNSCCLLTSFPLGSLPVLKCLRLWQCKNLKSISVLEEETAARQSLMFLEFLSVDECHELESISLPEFFTPSLRTFSVQHCNKLSSLPEPINNLTGLQSLWIRELPKLESFAEGGLPINLRLLNVGNVEGVFSKTAITKWGLELLTSLWLLCISGDSMLKKFMEMEVLLPNSLQILEIEDAREIQHLDGKWLQHLTSLGSLRFENCYKLKSLPEEGLPSTLSFLEIKSCPMLKESCQINRGKEWPKIAHIATRILV